MSDVDTGVVVDGVTSANLMPFIGIAQSGPDLRRFPSLTSDTCLGTACQCVGRRVRRPRPTGAERTGPAGGRARACRAVPLTVD